METVAIVINETVEQVSVTVTETVEAVSVSVSEAVAGLSAYQIAVINGYIGSEAQWIASFNDPLYRRVWQQPEEPTAAEGAKEGDLWIQTI